MNAIKSFFGAIGKFWRKGFFPKLLIIFIVLFGLNGIMKIKNNISDSIERKEEHKQTYVWPETELSNMIDKPNEEWDKGKILYDREDIFSILLYDRAEEDYHSYVESCKAKGFTEEHDNSSFGSSMTYRAKNKEGYSLEVEYYVEDGYYDINSLVVEIRKPEEPKEENNTENSNNSSDSNTDKEMVDGMRVEFKEAMDSYEAFYDEYCEFMKAYKEDSSNLELISEYADMNEKLIEMDEKFENWEDEDLNDAEMKYYLEVTTRITQKLLEVAE